MSGHTPGPWFVSEGNRNLNTVSANSKRGLVKAVAQVGGFFREDREANARLIAAAPELLAELKWLVELFEGSGMYDEEVFDKAKAAIAKATQP